MKCPNCGLDNPSAALNCDCGYNFEKKQKGPESLKEQAERLRNEYAKKRSSEHVPASTSSSSEGKTLQGESEGEESDDDKSRQVDRKKLYQSRLLFRLVVIIFFFAVGGLAISWYSSLPIVESVRQAFGNFFKAESTDISGLIQALSDKDKLWGSFPVAKLQTSDPSAFSAIRAAQALEDIGPAAVPALRQALKNEDRIMRARAAYVLGRIGLAAKEAVPALKQALKDEDSDVHVSAATALLSMDPAYLIQAFKTEESFPFLGLRMVGPAAVPTVIQALKDNDVRTQASIALGNFGSAAVPALKQALKDTDANVRLGAAVALALTGSAPKEAVPVLIQALNDEDRSVRENAAWALMRIGDLSRLGHQPATAARQAVPALVQVLRDSDPSVALQAALALANIDPAAQEAVPVLIQALSDKHTVPGSRWETARALGRMGPAAMEALPALIQALKDEDWILRRNAAQALGTMGPEAKEAIPGLKQALSDKDESVRQKAAEALKKIQGQGLIVFPPGKSAGSEASAMRYVPRDEGRAISSVRNLATSQITYASTKGRGKYASTLTELTNARLVDSVLGSGTKDGYTFSLTGSGSTFTLVARPLVYGETGNRSFYCDESGVIRYTTADRAATAEDPGLGR